MANVKVYNMQNKETGSMEISDALFQMEYNVPLIHQAVVTRLANERQGTKSTLTRSEVRGGEGKSPVGRPGPVTPWGKPALGYKTRKKKNRTNKFILKRVN